MSDFKIRTETIKPTKILDYFVETKEDRDIIDRLKSSSPIVLVGSRGVGKSFLLRVAEAELRKDIVNKKVVPVYISFTEGSVLQLTEERDFYQWMLAKMCSAFLRSLKKLGISIPVSLLGGKTESEEETYLNKLISEFEQTWKGNSKVINSQELPTIDDFKDAVEDICEEADIESVNFFIDEAAHILRPAQQRQFFNLYRDINSPYINCNAAIYPGVTSFGNNFQPIHDATFLHLDRDVSSTGYVEYMRNIVEKQADSKILGNIAKNMNNFTILSYAANGNPRALLKTLTQASSMSSRDINATIKSFYKSEVWEEHTLLSNKYSGFAEFIDWGRDFIEDYVLPDIKEKNDVYISEGKKTTRYFWIHKDTPETVKKALNLLCYTGIISLHTDAVKATRSKVGTRYSVNVGCVLALENTPVSSGLSIVRNTTIKRMTEYGENHSSYDSLKPKITDFNDSVINSALNEQLLKSVDFLDLPHWLIESLKNINLTQIKDVLSASENEIQQAYYVGKVRSRYIKNEATSAVFEYLSG
ncbi:ORC-CDC6 family AAA ATPase [Proteus mirabilis]|uniref:ORC-CDC6 family AAA ATPase n=1 Tax=Proteus mirabilis TaxID=584 RepID=UPI000666B81F|nr:ATP-binding protein [Proteus mirabilis]EKT9689123.1 hypothetical protein [Proteus mirabilis]EKX9509985.1 hypothetical protein [Proteus mirabilis]MBG2744774.1 hypothetical protein [Proteus mirabilis]MCE5372312.1 hypothetical protein [Proteus mirabilis]MDL2138103.1 hypothetical protein [Proteus mirabilis]